MRLAAAEWVPFILQSGPMASFSSSAGIAYRPLLNTVGEAGVPRILFLQNAPHLMDAYASLPAEVLGVDRRIDLPELAKRYPQRAVQGNLEPAILTAGPDATRAAAAELLSQMPAQGHIVNLGHGILPQTPLASVAALVDVVHSEKL